MTPVFFGTALGNFGVREMLDGLWSGRLRRAAANLTSVLLKLTKKNSVVLFLKFKPIWILNIATALPLCGCARCLSAGHENENTRIGKEIRIADAVTFMAGDRSAVEEALAGDIIGLHNHGTIQIGDTFTEGEDLKFTGIPHCTRIASSYSFKRSVEDEAVAKKVCSSFQKRVQRKFSSYEQ